MNRKTKKQIERTQQDIALLNSIIKRWEENPLSQPSKAVETHLNNLRDKVQALENELGEPQVETIKLPVEYKKLSPKMRQIVRDIYSKNQNYKCLHCGNDLQKNPTDEILRKKINRKLFPKTFFDYPVHLHHDHKTGLTIGVVHSFCNAVLWQYHGE